MLDRYDVRDDGRDRGDSWHRSFGSRGNAGERYRDESCNRDAPEAHVEAVPERLVHQRDVEERREVRQRQAARAVGECNVDDGDDRDDEEDEQKGRDRDGDRGLRPGEAQRLNVTAD